MSKTKFILKWTFIFSVLSLWTFFVIISSVAGLTKTTNILVYMQTSAGTEKATVTDLINILFNYDFEIEQQTTLVPVDRCSVRARNGIVVTDSMEFFENKLNFNVPNRGAAEGRGSLTSQEGKDRLSIKFNIKNITATNENDLTFMADATGKLNKHELDLDSLEINFDKVNNIVTITGSGIDEIDGELDVNFVDGCIMQEDKFFLITKNDKLSKSRTIEEVRSLLDENPELIDVHGRLRGLYKDFWWLIVPGGLGIVS